MQPYFLPFLPHFQMMARVDLWMVLDRVQFVDKGWINRNRILHPDTAVGWQFFSIPIKGKHRESKISELAINGVDWKAVLMGKLTVYARAPFYKETVGFLGEVLREDETSLSNFVTRSLRSVAEHLSINTKIQLVEDKHLQGLLNPGPGDWALTIAGNLNCATYVNPSSGVHLFDIEAFRKKGIALRAFSGTPPEYPQGRRTFVPGLSVVDTLMWLGRDETRGLVHGN